MSELILERGREVSSDEDDSVLHRIADTLDLSVSEIESKPEDIKMLLIHAYNNSANVQEARKKFLGILSPNYDLQREIRNENLKENPLKEVEELCEDGYDFIDGILNNSVPRAVREHERELQITRQQIKDNAERIKQKEKYNLEHSEECLEKH